MAADMIGAFPLIGFAGAAVQLLNSDGITYAEAGPEGLVEGVQGLSLEENANETIVPGANTDYATRGFIQSAVTTFKFAGISLKLLARMLGARYQLITDGDGNLTEIFDRRTDDKAPALKLDGLVDWIGDGMPKGDYHFLGLNGRVVGPPKIALATSEGAACELQIKWTRRKDGGFYRMRAAQVGTALAASNDITPPAKSTSTPAAGASSVAVTGNRTVTFTKPVLLVEADWAVYKVVGGVLTPVDIVTIAIDDAGKVVTLTTASLELNTSYRIVAVNVNDIHGNALDEVAINFTTVTS